MYNYENAQFEDSIEATQFVEDLQKMLNDVRFTNWCKSTDYTFGTETKEKLLDLQEKANALVTELNDAC